MELEYNPQSESIILIGLFDKGIVASFEIVSNYTNPKFFENTL